MKNYRVRVDGFAELGKPQPTCAGCNKPIADGTVAIVLVDDRLPGANEVSNMRFAHEGHDRETRTVNGVTFQSWPEYGTWYEVGMVDKVGGLSAPMLADGSFDPDDISETIVTREEA